MTPSKNVGPNLKPYSERFLFEFYENGKQKLPSTIIDWENCKLNWGKKILDKSVQISNNCSKKVGPNLKPYSERFLLQFYEISKIKACLPWRITK